LFTLARRRQRANTAGTTNYYRLLTLIIPSSRATMSKRLQRTQKYMRTLARGLCRADLRTFGIEPRLFACSSGVRSEIHSADQLRLIDPPPPTLRAGWPLGTGGYRMADGIAYYIRTPGARTGSFKL